MGADSVLSNLFNLDKNPISASHYRNFRSSAISEWSGTVACDEGFNYSNLDKLSCQYRPGAKSSRCSSSDPHLLISKDCDARGNLRLLKKCVGFAQKDAVKFNHIQHGTIIYKFKKASSRKNLRLPQTLECQLFLFHQP